MPDKLSNELFLAQEWLGLVSSKSLMGNVFLDLPDMAGDATLFLGLGIGIGRTSADYASVWSRSTDPADIATGRDLPNSEEIARNPGQHLELGAGHHGGYAVQLSAPRRIRLPAGDEVSVDVRARWTASGEFAGTVVWDPLRSHVPNLRRDRSEPVDGKMSHG